MDWIVWNESTELNKGKRQLTLKQNDAKNKNSFSILFLLRSASKLYQEWGHVYKHNRKLRRFAEWLVTVVSSVIDDWHTYNNCWRVRASGPARPREWRWARSPPQRFLAQVARSHRSPFLRSSPFRSVPCCSVLCCLCALLWITPRRRPFTHVCRLWWLTTARHGTVRYPLLIRSVTPGVSRIYHCLRSRAFGFPRPTVSFGGLLLENLFSARGWRHPKVLALKALRLRYWRLILECTFKLLMESVFEIQSELQYLLSSLGPFVLKLRWSCSSSITFCLALKRKGWKPQRNF